METQAEKAKVDKLLTQKKAEVDKFNAILEQADRDVAARPLPAPRPRYTILCSQRANEANVELRCD